MSKSDPSDVLVFHINGAMIIDLFQGFGLVLDGDYAYVKTYGESTPDRVLSLTKTDRSQLIFLPHQDDFFVVSDLVQAIKSKNEKAVVVTLGFNNDPIVLPEGSPIDAVVNLYSPGEDTKSIPSMIIHAFKDSLCTREHLATLTKSDKK